MGVSSIEWTDKTWNPTRGCDKVSPGCKHCYAETFAERFRGVAGHPYERGFDPRLAPDKLEDPLRWRKPARVFVNSMSDLFHESFPDEYIAQVFGVMAACPQHTFQVLTKRPDRMRRWFAAPAVVDVVADYWRTRGLYKAQVIAEQAIAAFRSRWPLPNVWLGVSVEDQRWADKRIPDLLRTPAAVRFLSCEPLLERVSLTKYLDHGHRPENSIAWVITGAESGRGARAMDEDWVRALRDECAIAGVSFFYKQRLDERGRKIGLPVLDGRQHADYPACSVLA